MVPELMLSASRAVNPEPLPVTVVNDPVPADTDVKPETVASRLTVTWLPLAAVVIFVPPAISSVSESKSIAPLPESPWKSKSCAVTELST